MARYWCETCKSQNFKTDYALFSHLLSEHKIKVFKEYFCHHPSFSKFWKCRVCNWEGSYDDTEEHNKSHAKYFVDGKSKRSIISVLHYIDKKYGVHCAYVWKGFSKKPMVYLDGIAK